MNMQILDLDLLYEWQQREVTKVVWNKILNDYNPWASLLTCSKEDLGRYQGQAEVLEVLKSYFEAK